MSGKPCVVQGREAILVKAAQAAAANSPYRQVGAKYYSKHVKAPKGRHNRSSKCVAPYNAIFALDPRP